MKLRPYQDEAIKAARGCWRDGLRSVLWALATGTGKTVAFSWLICEAVRLGQRALVLAHRSELLDQARERLCDAAPWMRRITDIVQGPRDEFRASCVIASVQSIVRERRLGRYPEGYFGLCVIDEAHHAAAQTYRTILEALKPGRILGVTATPRRGDGVGLAEVFERVAYAYELRDAIADGWLCDVRQYAIRTEVSLDRVGSHHGDFSTKQLSHEVNSPERNRLVVDAYQAHGQGRKGLAFAVDVEHARALAEGFRSFGIPSQPIWGAMPAQDRKHVLAQFRAGRIRVLTNCEVLTEGFDEPSIACVLMARPTQSGALYEQMLGRGTRLHPGKQDLLVLDFTDNCTKHQLVSAPELLGLPVETLEGGSAKKAAGEAKQEAKERQAQIDLYQAQPLAYRLCEVDPFGSRSVVTLATYQPGAHHWEGHAASQAQLDLLRMRGLGDSVCRSLTKGEASHLIDQVAELEHWQSAPAEPVEPTEAILALRKAIQSHATRYDRENRLPDGSTNRSIYEQFRKTRGAMTADELQAVLAWLTANKPFRPRAKREPEPELQEALF